MCKGFDCGTHRCRVYEERTETYPCHKVTLQNILELHARGILPDSCAYVRYKKGQPLLKEVPTVKMIPYEKAPLFIKEQFFAATERWVSSKQK